MIPVIYYYFWLSPRSNQLVTLPLGLYKAGKDPLQRHAISYDSVDTEFSPLCRGYMQQAGRVRTMEQIRLASVQGWSILRNPPEMCQSI